SLSLPMRLDAKAQRSNLQGSVFGGCWSARSASRTDRPCVAVFARVNHLLDEGILPRSADVPGQHRQIRKYSVIVDGKLCRRHLVDMLSCGPLPAASALHHSETPVISPPSHTRILARKAVR